MTDTLELDGRSFQALSVATTRARLLMVQGTKGFLGCGYFSVMTPDKFNEAVAIVTGVKTYDDMFAASVIKVSRAAAELGVREGMTGREALALLA